MTTTGKKQSGLQLGLITLGVVMAGFAAYHIGTEAEVPGE